MVQPTDEQTLAVDKFKTGRPLKITAFAGTGKTSTLIQMARTRPSRGLYLAFNKAIALANTAAEAAYIRSRLDGLATHGSAA